MDSLERSDGDETMAFEASDPGLQELAEYASKVLDAPVALVTRLGEDRQTFFANVGFGRDWTTLEESFCVHAVLGEGLFEIPDATQDSRFAANPLVTGPEHIRFYAGVPVRTGDGTPVNALCILGPEPRELSEFQRETLVFLGRQVESRLALRTRERQAAAAEKEARRSEELLRLVSDRVPARIAYVDKDYRFRFLNDSYLAQVGMTREKTIGLTVVEAMGEELFLQAKGNLDRALAGETHTQEFEAKYGTGTRPIRATYVPDFDKTGVVRGVVVQVLDLSEQRASEAARHASETQYRTLFESVDEGFCTFEMIFDEAGRPIDYRFLEINDAFVDLTGLTREIAFSGKTMRELAPAHEQAWYDRYGEVALTGNPLRVEDKAEALGHRYEIHAFRVGGSDSRIVGALFKDVAERYAAEQALYETRQRLDRTLETASVAAFDWDVQRDLVTGNDLLALFFGVPNDNAKGPLAPYFEGIHPDDRESTQAAIKRALDKGGPYETRYRVTGADGRERWVLARGDATLGKTDALCDFRAWWSMSRPKLWRSRVTRPFSSRWTKVSAWCR